LDLILMTSRVGLVGLDPATGSERLNYVWECQGYRALQPRVVGTDTVILPTGIPTGTRALRFTTSHGRLEAEELWTSRLPG
jgi:hypothetical protein